MRMVAGELGPMGIWVTGVASGLMRSPKTDGHFENSLLQIALERETPLDCLDVVEDAAGVSLWLAAYGYRSTTGQIMDITSRQSHRRMSANDKMKQ
jgi:NAD(P)-dependent dehydrogenase (short-subunit alcohol dehydrogenase family)